MPEQFRMRCDDGRLAPRQRREVDLVHGAPGEIVGEPVCPAVVAGAEDEQLLDAPRERGEQVFVDEAVAAQAERGQPGQFSPFGQANDRARDAKR